MARISLSSYSKFYLTNSLFFLLPLCTGIYAYLYLCIIIIIYLRNQMQIRHSWAYDPGKKSQTKLFKHYQGK